MDDNKYLDVLYAINQALINSCVQAISATLDFSKYTSLADL